MDLSTLKGLTIPEGEVVKIEFMGDVIWAKSNCAQNGHTYGDWVVTRPATCTQTGLDTKKCSICGQSETRITDALGHNYVKTTVPPTKSEQGYDLYKCSRCGDEYRDNFVPALGSEGLSYALLDDNTYSVNGIGTCTDTEVVIPSTYNGKPVSAIANYALQRKDTITSIYIPDSVTSIGIQSIRFCTSLTKVRLSNRLTVIWDEAFYGNTALVDVSIPDSLTEIRNTAFAKCSALKEIIIPVSVATIGANVFSECTSLSIFCEADSQPAGWNTNWNSSNRRVTWGYTKS